MKRRSFLTRVGLGVTGSGLVGCARAPRTAAPAVARLCAALAKPALALSGENEILRRFRELECHSLALVAEAGADERHAAAVQALFIELHAMLAALPYSVATAEAWRRFYGLTARLHEVRNAMARRAPLPVYAYNGHHHAARLWLDESARRGPRGPLLHFDSHSDMRGLVNAPAILSAVAKLQHGGATRDHALTALRQLISDHATPVSAGVLGRAATDIIWAAPSWSAILDFVQRPLLYAEVGAGGLPGVFRLLHDRTADPDGALPAAGAVPWSETSSLDKAQRGSLRHQRPIRLTLIRSYPKGPNTLESLLRAIPRGGFILDIDLDYLLTVDRDSGFRRPSMNVPDRHRAIQLYAHFLQIARQLVDERLSQLADLLRSLRKKGRVPTMVTIADSTYRPFSPFLAGVGHWEYMPYEFAGYAHWRLRRDLATIYAADGVAANS